LHSPQGARHRHALRLSSSNHGRPWGWPACTERERSRRSSPDRQLRAHRSGTASLTPMSGPVRRTRIVFVIRGGGAVVTPVSMHTDPLPR
jgi:hypothetical protein